MKIKRIFLFAVCAAAVSCATNVSRNETTNNNSVGQTANVGSAAQNVNKVEINAAVSGNYDSNANSESGQRINPRGDAASGAKDKSACSSLTRAGKKIVAKQSFPFDAKPFEAACFVTFAAPDSVEPSLDSEFFIYQNGKEVFKFPNQFNGITTGCWIEGVSFADLNDDSLTDIAIVGMCSAKSAPYNENMFYANSGDGFVTDETANYKLTDFKKTKDIENFVRTHQQDFFE